MSGLTAETAAQRAFDQGLLSDLELQEVWSTLGSRNVPLEDFLQLMVRREFMTNYQVERLVSGETTGFFFGDYKVLYLVGTGSFARVYRAVNTATKAVVAVKVLRRRYSDNPSQYGQFVREGELGCTLRHPNIVPSYEVYSQGSMHFLTMEFVEGQNLRDFAKIRGKLEPAEATRLMTGISSGLQYAFENGLSHRDLKMSNVLVSSTGQAKIVDFGLAAVDEGVNDELLGEAPNARTIDYAALERATGVRRDDARSDVFFLGCIYYNMLAGRPPLSETKDRIKRLSKTRFTQIQPIQIAEPTLPQPVAFIVNKAMSLNADRRYQTPGKMVHDLRLASRRLENGEVESALGGLGQTPAAQPQSQQSIMIVESNDKMQDIFRAGLKRVGYRVLLTQDPERALERFGKDTDTADCVVFSAQDIGQRAVRAFNRLGEDKKAGSVPALLLLDQSQKKWKQAAKTADHRVVMSMPITMKQLRHVLAKLIPDSNDTSDVDSSDVEDSASVQNGAAEAKGD